MKEQKHTDQVSLDKIETPDKYCVIGLGYVGLPLLLSIGKHRLAIGYDTDAKRINELKSGVDRNGTFSSSDLQVENVLFTSDEADIQSVTVYIVAVPTPITKYNTPNLHALRLAATTIGRHLAQGDLVIFESTVYPGCTEEYCIPILDSTSKLKAGIDFKVGYSPERINPGDKVNTLANTQKIISGLNAESLDAVRKVFELVVKSKLHEAPSIKVAEAAKLVENVQRDLNIALMNELSLIFDKLDIDTHDVIEAAGTKWNFQKYYPGLVGGHCISVDPYYLTYKAKEVGYYPEVILSGRNVNDNLSQNVAKKVVQIIGSQDIKLSESRILVMGVTFKENVSDIRNSKVIDLITDLTSFHIDVDIVDPYASSEELYAKANLTLQKEIRGKYNCIIVAVQHTQYKSLDEAYFLSIAKANAALIDIKGIYRKQINSMSYWTL